MEEPLSFISKLLHAHLYSISRALTKILGEAQTIIAKEYTKNLCKLLERMGVNPLWLAESPNRLCELLVKRGMVKQCSFKFSGKTVEFIVDGCTLAPYVHQPLEVSGFSGDICPLGLIAFSILTLNQGYKLDSNENIFNYVQFNEKLSYFTDNGSITRFKLMKKIRV